MFKLRITTLCGGILLIASTFANAQNAPPAAPPREPNVAGAPAVSQQPAENAEGHTYRAKQIIGSKVSLDGNVAAGTVDDIVLGEDGYVEYLIVMNNNKLVTVPWDATAFNFQKQTAVVKITPEQFQKVPTYTAQQYPAFSTPQYRTSIYKSYGLTPRERRIERRQSRP